jgi:hypothetical protein
MDQNELNEKRLELVIEKLIQQLITDLNVIEDRNRITNANFDYMAEVFNSLSKAEHHIVSAISWSKGVNPSKYIYSKHDLIDALQKAIKKTK